MQRLETAAKAKAAKSGSNKKTSVTGVARNSDGSSYDSSLYNAGAVCRNGGETQLLLRAGAVGSSAAGPCGSSSFDSSSRKEAGPRARAAWIKERSRCSKLRLQMSSLDRESWACRSVVAQPRLSNSANLLQAKEDQDQIMRTLNLVVARSMLVQLPCGLTKKEGQALRGPWARSLAGHAEG